MRRAAATQFCALFLLCALGLSLRPAPALASTTAPCGSTPTVACIMGTYNVVTEGSLTTSNDIEGSSVVGGNLAAATLFADTARLPKKPVSYVYGTVKDTINIDNGGSINYGALASGVKINLNGGGTATKGGFPDPLSVFTTALNTKSSQLAAEAADATLTATTANSKNELLIAGKSSAALSADSGIAYVTITASALTSLLTSFTGTAPTIVLGSGVTSAIINVSGTPTSGTDLGSGLNLDSNVYQNVLFNFYDATSLQLNSWSTSVLAPDASVTLDGSAFDGFIYADNLSAGAEIHNYYYTGRLTVPEPGTLALLAAGLAAIAATRRALRPDTKRDDVTA
jgi:choice-of-anchor A domain-containing protein